MEWSNYLFARGGDYYDENWNATINDSKAIQAINDYRCSSANTLIMEYVPISQLTVL